MAKTKAPKRGKKTNIGLKASRLAPLSLKSVLTGRQKIKRKHLIVVMTLMAAVGGFLIYSSLAAGPRYDTSDNVYDTVGQAKLKDDPAHGISYKGLKLVKATANHPCKGIFEAPALKIGDKPLCTHGSDTSTTNDQTFAYAGHAFSNTIPFAQKPVPCATSGYRILLVFITNRDYPSTIPGDFRATAKRMEGELEYSALHSGPGSTNRHYRFATDSACSPLVKIIRTPNTYVMTDPGATVSYLQTKMNMTNPERRYLIWDYDSLAKFCGMAFGSGGDLLNKTAGYAVVDTTCWGTNAEIHEITHTLGAVSNAAPHTTGSGHCRDRRDPMCYGSTTYIDPNCQDSINEFVLDCNKDDYFNTGTISPSNFLYDHWNTANSPYMQK